MLLWNELFAIHCSKEYESPEIIHTNALYSQHYEEEHEGSHESAEVDAKFIHLWNRVFGEPCENKEYEYPNIIHDSIGYSKGIYEGDNKDSCEYMEYEASNMLL